LTAVGSRKTLHPSFCARSTASVVFPDAMFPSTITSPMFWVLLCGDGGGVVLRARRWWGRERDRYKVKKKCMPGPLDTTPHIHTVQSCCAWPRHRLLTHIPARVPLCKEQRADESRGPEKERGCVRSSVVFTGVLHSQPVNSGFAEHFSFGQLHTLSWHATV